MCGIIGTVGNSSAAADLYTGLLMLQHRGQDAAGIVTFDNRFHSKKENGLVTEIFGDEDSLGLQGNLGIGHVRYRTTGSLDPSGAQPFVLYNPFGVALIHNGNLTNYNELKDLVCNTYHRYLNSDSDTEVLANVFSQKLMEVKTDGISVEEIFKAVTGTMETLKGSYAIIALLANHGLLAFRDPYAIRPLVYGKRENGSGTEYMVASESVALESQGFEIIADVQPGEAIFIDMNNKFYQAQCVEPKAKKPCIFEYVYLARPDSLMDDVSVYKTRLRMGEKLAEKIKASGIEIDSVIPIPETARPTAITIAQELGKPYREGLIKNRYVGRTFIMPGNEQRKKSIKQKLNPVVLELKNKNVLLVDDSIVRGNTARKIVEMVRASGAKNVYFASACPPILNPCVYGVDIPTRKELVAVNLTHEQIAKEISADAIFYQEVEDLIEAAGVGSEQTNEFCTGCLDGRYAGPDVDEELLERVEEGIELRDIYPNPGQERQVKLV